MEVKSKEKQLANKACTIIQYIKLPWHCTLMDNLSLHRVQSALPSPNQQIYRHRRDKFHLILAIMSIYMIVTIKLFFFKKDLPCHIKHCLHIKQKGLTSMTQNRNFGGTLDLRDKFVASPWNHQINYIIQLKDKQNADTNFCYRFQSSKWASL